MGSQRHLEGQNCFCRGRQNQRSALSVLIGNESSKNYTESFTCEATSPKSKLALSSKSRDLLSRDL